LTCTGAAACEACATPDAADSVTATFDARSQSFSHKSQDVELGYLILLLLLLLLLLVQQQLLLLLQLLLANPVQLPMCCCVQTTRARMDTHQCQRRAMNSYKYG
jgi:hypothetical protein